MILAQFKVKGAKKKRAAPNYFEAALITVINLHFILERRAIMQAIDYPTHLLTGCFFFVSDQLPF